MTSINYYLLVSPILSISIYHFSFYLACWHKFNGISVPLQSNIQKSYVFVPVLLLIQLTQDVWGNGLWIWGVVYASQQGVLGYYFLKYLKSNISENNIFIEQKMLQILLWHGLLLCLLFSFWFSQFGLLTQWQFGRFWLQALLISIVIWPILSMNLFHIFYVMNGSLAKTLQCWMLVFWNPFFFILMHYIKGVYLLLGFSLMLVLLKDRILKLIFKKRHSNTYCSYCENFWSRCIGLQKIWIIPSSLVLASLPFISNCDLRWLLILLVGFSLIYSLICFCFPKIIRKDWLYYFLLLGVIAITAYYYFPHNVSVGFWYNWQTQGVTPENNYKEIMFYPGYELISPKAQINCMPEISIKQVNHLPPEAVDNIWKDPMNGWLLPLNKSGWIELMFDDVHPISLIQWVPIASTKLLDRGVKKLVLWGSEEGYFYQRLHVWNEDQISASWNQLVFKEDQNLRKLRFKIAKILGQRGGIREIEIYEKRIERPGEKFKLVFETRLANAILLKNDDIACEMIFDFHDHQEHYQFIVGKDCAEWAYFRPDVRTSVQHIIPIFGHLMDKIENHQWFMGLRGQSIIELANIPFKITLKLPHDAQHSFNIERIGLTS